MKAATIAIAILFVFGACRDSSKGSKGNDARTDTVSIGGDPKADSVRNDPNSHGVASGQPNKDRRFSRTASFGKIVFQVYSPNNALHNSIIIQPSGTIDSTMIQTGVAGDVMDAFAADLNGDGYPEIYYTVFSQSKQLNLYGYGSEENKRLTPVFMPDINEDKKFGRGHMIGDDYKIEGGKLNRFFPIYNDQDPMSSPSGGNRVVSYRLIPGKNGWILKPMDAKEVH